MVKQRTHTAVLMLAAAVLALGMAAVDWFVSPPYAVKSAIKLVLFLLVPLGLLLLDQQRFAAVRQIFKPTKKGSLAVSFALGAAVFALILAAYFAAKNVFDFSGITDSLTSEEGVTKENFVFVSFYIAIVNAFLEEWFFRGFSFLLLKPHVGKKAAAVFSAALFALYHLGMTDGWFHPAISALALLGLFVGGLIFDALCDKFDCIYPSYLCHMCCNLSINLIGFTLFGIW